MLEEIGKACQMIKKKKRPRQTVVSWDALFEDKAVKIGKEVLLEQNHDYYKGGCDLDKSQRRFLGRDSLHSFI